MTVLPVAPTPCTVTTPVINSAPLCSGMPAISSPRVFPFARVPRTSRAITSLFYIGIPTNNGTRVPPLPTTIRTASLHTPLRRTIRNPHALPPTVQTICTVEAPTATDISPVTTTVVEEAWDPDTMPPPLLYLVSDGVEEIGTNEHKERRPPVPHLPPPLMRCVR